MAAPSPKIIRLHWGSVETEAGRFRDAKLWPGGGRGWDWRETGTAHHPGVQPTDVAELLSQGARTVIIGCGQNQRLAVMDETREVIENAGAKLEIYGSGKAVERFNAATENGEAVGALIHSTC